MTDSSSCSSSGVIDLLDRWRGCGVVVHAEGIVRGIFRLDRADRSSSVKLAIPNGRRCGCLCISLKSVELVST